MKRFKSIFRAFVLYFLCSLATSVSAQEVDSTLLIKMDSVDISLLTCGPGSEVYTLYGHTAIRVNDRAANEDLVVNYGMFSFDQPFFVLRFVFGLTDYQMGITTMEHFMKVYQTENRWIKEQRLNLSATEKAIMLKAIAENYEPQNRTYRYNYFYDNCTTRARDMIVDHVAGKVSYAESPEDGVSFRELTHAWNANHRWARFGNDLLLGLKADQPTTLAQRQFLPDNLRQDFAKAVVTDANGNRRQLVADEQQIGHATKSLDLSVRAFVTPTLCFIALAVLIVVATLIEFKHRRRYWLLDAILLAADGLAGVILLLMVFSQHPTVSLNLQILLLNPLSLVFLYPAVSKSKRGELHWFWIAFACCILMFLIGNLLQCYAEGMNILALSLLVRCWVNIETKSLRRIKK